MEAQHQLLQNYCPVCGSAMAYSPGKKSITCPACNFSRPLEKKTGIHVQDRKLEEGVRFEGWIKGMGARLEGRKCDNCKALLATEMGGFPSPSSCPICGADDLEPDDSFEEMLQPWGVIPFAISRGKAVGRLRKYLRTSPLRPLSLPAVAQSDALKPIFAPLWCVDAFVKASWTAKSGFVYAENEDSEAVQWEPTAGYLEKFFENLSILPLTGLDRKFFADRLDFDLGAVVPFHPDFLEGNLVLGYDHDPKKSLGDIQKDLDQLVRMELVEKVPGKKFDSLSFKADRSTLAFRNLLVPLWVAHYRYAGRHFTFVVNGQNGQCLGSKPLSIAKVLGLSLLASILIVIGVLSLH